jgi:hypothetical protein
MFSPYVIRVIKSRRLKLSDSIVHTGQLGNSDSVLVGKPEWKKSLGIRRPT